MTRYLGTAVRMTILTAIVLGLVYPLAITGVAQVLFPGTADGSLVKVNGRVVGSSLIAQGFTAAKYFHPRPSAAGSGYDAMASSASNLGPTSRVLVDRVKADVRTQIAQDPGLRLGAVPVDMVTTSGSGLDPHITPANARAQAPRVAAARNMSTAAVLRLVAKNTAGRTFGFIGEPRVNVLELNLALDAAQARGGT
jgi:potassium-transporting ATPase KdpC subunit